MLRADFSYRLPPELIAQYPPAARSAGRLLQLHADGALQDRMIRDLPQLVRPGDLLVFNDTRVLPARLYAVKQETGGRVEILVERVLDENRALVQLRAAKAPSAGVRLRVESRIDAEVGARRGPFYELRFHDPRPVVELLQSCGHIPLPPYIRRGDEVADHERYQTVFARRPGAVAAPTAGLHFDAALLNELSARGVEQAWVTLHVGAGTFQPVRTADLNAHRMHSEWAEVSADTCELIDAARRRGGRVIAVGTTVVRSLETAAAGGRLRPFAGDTELFIKPGYRFRVVDALVTNFHLPESTLLVLVCAFAGRDQVLSAYRHAVERRYRFFSYGDAMFVARQS